MRRIENGKLLGRASLGWILGLMSLLQLAACSSNDSPGASRTSGGATSTGGKSALGGTGGSSPANGGASGSGAAGGDAEGEPPVYVIANEVTAGDETTSYVSVVRSLDIEELDFSHAAEFAGGRATIATNAGWVYVAPPESGEIRRYGVSETGELEPDGVVSFLNYGLDEITLDSWGNSFVSATKAYAHNSVDGTSVIWNPTTMQIEGEVDLGEFNLVRPELGELNSSSVVVRGNRMFRMVFWTNWEEEITSEEQYLAVYDTDRDVLIALEEEKRCPGLSNLVSKDEAGNLYFSNWIYNVGETVLRGSPESCVLRLAPNSERLEQDFQLDYAAATQGMQGANFTYLADGQGVMSVFYPERSPILADSTPVGLVSEPAWKVWSVDLEGKAAPLEGLDWMLGALTPVRLDGRSFLMLPGEDWSIMHVHEIVDGAAVPRFDIPGWSYQFLKLR